MNASIFGWPVRVVGRRPSPRCGGLHQRLMRPLPRPRRWNGPRPLKEVLTMNGLPPIRLEGIRTLDLLHGKQNVQRRVGPEYACEPEVFAAARVREGFPAFTWESRGFGYPMGSQLPRLWPPSALDGHVVVWPGPGTDTFVQAVRCEVRSARPDDRAGLAVNRDLGEALRVRAWSTTGRRILLMTSTSPLSPSVKRRGRTPWRITAASVMSGVRPIVGAARSAGVSHQRGRPTSARKGDARLLGGSRSLGRRALFVAQESRARTPASGRRVTVLGRELACHEPCLVGEHDRLHPVAQFELAQQVGNVCLDRVLAEHELGCDLRVREPTGDEPQDLELPRGEFGDRGGNGAGFWARGARELLDQSAGDRGREQGIAGGGGAHRVQQPVGRGILEQESARPDTERLVDVLVAIEGREHEHRRVELRIREDALSGS